VIVGPSRVNGTTFFCFADRICNVPHASQFALRLFSAEILLAHTETNTVRTFSFSRNKFRDGSLTNLFSRIRLKDVQETKASFSNNVAVLETPFAPPWFGGDVFYFKGGQRPGLPLDPRRSDAP
jgi:hypothetical protein